MIHDPQTLKLGRKPVKLDSRTLRLGAYLNDELLPVAPQALDWGSKVHVWGMMENDKLGDCTCAAVGHIILSNTSHRAELVVPPDSKIVKLYEEVTNPPFNSENGENDNGAVELDVLNYLQKNKGYPFGKSHRVLAYMAVNPKNIDHVKKAIFLFGSVYAGVDLPLTAQEQIIWDTEEGPEATPGSWGGHAVPFFGYDDKHASCVTWGNTKKATWEWFQEYVVECYAVVWCDWVETGRLSPGHFNLEQLLADVKAI